MSRADGILVVSLTYSWWDMIESGEKLEEYRSYNLAENGVDSPGSWFAKLCTVPYLHPWHKEQQFTPYHTLRAQRAYTGVWLERKIRRIRWGTPRPEWSGGTITGECFVIELEPK